MTETTAETPAPRRRRIYQAWNSVYQAGAKATRWASERGTRFGRWVSSLGRRGGHRIAQAASTGWHAGKVVSIWLARFVWAVVELLLAIVLNVVSVVLLTIFAAVVLVLGAVALLVLSVALSIGGFLSAMRDLFRRQPGEEEVAPTEVVQTPVTDPTPDPAELVKTNMDDLLERKRDVEVDLLATPKDPELLGQLAFLEFLLRNPWAVFPDEERKAFAAVWPDHRSNGIKQAPLKRGFLSERDLWVTRLGVSDPQAA
jgi:hypothetical protein